MNALKAELERKRKATEVIRNENDPGSKYIRQKDLMSHKYNELEERQRRLDEDRQLKAGGIVLPEAKVLTHSLTYLLTHLLTHSPTYSLTHSLTHLLTHSLT